MQSFHAFLLKLSALKSNETQGEIKTAPRRGEERAMRGMGRVVEGCGCEMWLRRERARFAPAESPVRIILFGEILRLLRTWFRSMAACWSCRGYGAAGARSGMDSLVWRKG